MALINLQLGIEKPNNVYRLVLGMESVPSSHGDDVHYLLLHAIVNWHEGELQREIFCIAMQYSDILGEFVNVSQPAHIAVEDLDTLQEHFASFIRRQRQSQ
ncbi:MAG: hypothetical protein KF823_12940 [Xanthomonadales bacterium]|nr:hypothetical protein [Xanthomonadales bacterium]